jgi:thiamine monophosphate kinase
VPVTKIGMFQHGDGVHVLSDEDTVMSFEKPGWQHFR